LYPLKKNEVGILDLNGYKLIACGKEDIVLPANLRSTSS
jgi:hypothetical protein